MLMKTFGVVSRKILCLKEYIYKTCCGPRYWCIVHGLYSHACSMRACSLEANAAIKFIFISDSFKKKFNLYNNYICLGARQIRYAHIFVYIIM